MNWHGISSKFSDYYIQRQSNDKSIFKSTKLSIMKRQKEYAVMVEKKELQEFENARQMLLLKKKKEKAKNSRLVTLLENNKALDKRMDSAAVEIQRWVRGFQVRRRYRDEMWKITLKILNRKVGYLESTVDKCLMYIGEMAHNAAVVIQKHARRYLSKKLYRNLIIQRNIQRQLFKLGCTLKIQKLIRGFLNRRRFRRAVEARHLSEKLEKIRKNLLICKLKEFWQRKKFVWETIRRKYKEKPDFEPAEDPSEYQIEPLKENTASISKIVSAASSHIFTQINPVILKEPVHQEKPPKAPKPLTLQYLKPTEAYLSRITNETEEKMPKTVKLRMVSGRRYQRNTSSRTNYVHLVQTEKSSKSRAASADYKKKRERLYEKTEVKENNALSLVFENDVPRYFNKVKSPVPSLLSKLEDQPAPVVEEQTEKIYIYNPPKFHSLSFRDALPDVNALLETYAKNIKK